MLKENVQKVFDLDENCSKGLRHAKTYLRYHIVFSTKYRRKCLDRIRETVLDAFRYAKEKSDFIIKTMNIDKDRIHLLVQIPPNRSIASVVARLKQMSTSYIWSKEENYLSMFYWKDKHYLWTHGYYCSTIGNVSEKIVWYYIENQGK